MINKTLRKVIVLTPRHIEMMEILSSQIGLDKSTDLMKRGLEELFRSYNPSYKIGNGLRNAVKTEEQLIVEATAKSKAKIIGEKAEEELRLQPKIDICLNMLKGEIETSSSGTKICRFTQYNGFDAKKDAEQVVPLSQVGAYLAETSLFIPAKEVVFKNRKDIKDKFDENI